MHAGIASVRNPKGRLFALLLVALTLAACGGGAADSGSPAPTTPPVTPPTSPPTSPPTTPPVTPTVPTLAASPTVVSVEALGSDALATTRTVALTLQNPTGQAVAFSGLYTAKGIQSASMDWVGLNGTLVITFKPANTLAAGVYDDTIDLKLCSALPCTSEIGTRQTISVNYTVVEVPTLVSFSRTSVALTGNNVAWHASLEELIGVTITRGKISLWPRTTIAGALVMSAGVSLSLPPGTTGTVQLLMRPPSTLGAGTYTDSVKVEICLDAQCSRQAIGSPVTIPVTYTVTGNALPTTQVHWSEGFLTGADLITSETGSPKMTLTLVPSEPVYEGVYVRHTSSATGLISSVVERQIASGSQFDSMFGLYDITLKPPAALGSGIFTDTMEFEACFDAACTKPISNSKHTVSLSVMITATEGREFTRRSLPASTFAEGVVWSSVDQSLYVDASAGTARKIMRVNPVTMVTGTSTTLPETGLRNMTVTPDGSYLYVGSKTASFVHRLQLPSLTKDLTVSLGYSPASYPLKVNDLAAVPGQPRSFVVALEHNSGNHAGVVVYDDATARPASVGINPAQGFEIARWLVPAATPGNFVSLSYGPSQPVVNTLDQLSVTAAGISTSSSTVFGAPGGIVFFPKPQRVGTRLFLNSGAVLDATTGALLGTLTSIDSGGAYAVLGDEARGLVFVLTKLQDQKDYVVSYDATTLKRLAIAPVYGAPAFPPGSRSMTLWGNDGLAITDGGQLIILSGTFFSTYRGTPTM